LLTDTLTESEILGDKELDLMSGAAGTILGFAAVHRATRSERALALARQCGKHLLATQTGNAWRTFDSIALTGMSHGAAGIAYALVRLYALTGEEPFLTAAMA